VYDFVGPARWLGGGDVIRELKLVVFALLFCVSALLAQQRPAQPDPAPDGTVAKVIARENQEMEMIRKRSPMVETYVQKVKVVEIDGTWRPDGDHYFIGRADLSHGLDLVSLANRNTGTIHRMVGTLTRLFDFGAQFLPKGFLQMIFLDNDGLNTDNYKFDYVRREFLGEVRTLVFDVAPTQKAGNGRFAGRIWVEDEAFTIVRFNGSYASPHDAHVKFHFDTWRVNAGPNLWLPAFIYSEEVTEGFPVAKAQTYKAQTRLWGYNSGHVRQEQELSQLRVESATAVIDKSDQDTDLSPYQEQRAWDQQALNNISEKLERIGLLAPAGEIDKILDSVVNNLIDTNHLVFSPEIHCRVMMTSTIESFTMGHTIVLSRGLIDVLPDEASLAAMLAKELSFVLLDRKGIDTRYAFYDSLRFDEKTTFQHFDFNRRPEQDAEASAKSAELLKNSQYKDDLDTAEMFVTELRERAHQIPNLISPRLGDARLLQLPVVSKSEEENMASHIVALPLGGRIKLDPWDDTLQLLKARPTGPASTREKMPFEVTPFMIYLTRVSAESPKASQIVAPSAPGT
jgi:hypothetical protein